MTTAKADGVRAMALVGPTGGGKTTLMEAMLLAAGAIERRAPGQLVVGDSSPEARARGHSVELNLAGFDFLGDRYAVIDMSRRGGAGGRGGRRPAGGGPGADRRRARSGQGGAAAAGPPPARDARRSPRPVRQQDGPGARAARRPARRPRAGLDRAAGRPPAAGDRQTRRSPASSTSPWSAPSSIAPARPPRWSSVTPEGAGVEADARFHMLEQLADFDDELMEQLLSDVVPSREPVFADLVREMNEGLIVPVFFGSALNGFGVRRLLKALRHETPPPRPGRRPPGPRRAAAPAAYVLKTAYAGQAGKLAYARVFGGAAGGRRRAGAAGRRAGPGRRSLLRPGRGAEEDRRARRSGEVVADRQDRGGARRRGAGRRRGAAGTGGRAAARAPLFALAIAAANRKDDVRLSGALAKLLEEDPGLTVTHDPESHQILVAGQGEGHVRLALERLKRRFARRHRHRRAGHALPRDDPRRRDPARPAQEADRRPRPVRRRHHRDQAAAARRRLRLRQQGHRRRGAPAVDPGGGAGGARRPRQGAARLSGRRRRGDADRRPDPPGRTPRKWPSAPPAASPSTRA